MIRPTLLATLLAGTPAPLDQVTSEIGGQLADPLRAACKRV